MNSFLETPIPDCPEGEFKCKGSVSGSGSSPGNRCILMRFRCDGDNGMSFIFEFRLNY